MKRALAILAACSLFGFVGLGQITGEWDTTLNIIPDVGLESSTLTLTYTVAGWDLTSISAFGSTGFASQDFEFAGMLGPVALEGAMAFSPGDEVIYDECGIVTPWTVLGPHYMSSEVSTTVEFAGLELGLTITHDADYVAILEGEQTPGDTICYDKYFLTALDYYYCATDDKTLVWLPSYMTWTMDITADPFTASVVFDDVCTGIQFKEATFGFTDLSLCCGILFDVEMGFNKCYGFDYLKFTAEDLFPICCGISFDASVKFTTTSKTVTLEPTWEGISGCFEFYGDLDYEGGENGDLLLNSIRVDGFKVRCELAECNYIEFVTFLSPDKAANYGYYGVFEEGEFEYVKLGFCGPGCCGGEYSLAMSIFFDNGGGLFGISRLGADMSIPVMANFAVNAAFGVTTAGDTSLDIGWTFTF
ncbi:MAG: hypothetical protein ACP5G2_07005 [Candidatus Bipolaricaulaceae bacterium]